MTPTPTPTATTKPRSTATSIPGSDQPSGRCKDPAELGYEQDGQWIVGECATITSIAKHLGVEVSDLIAANPQIGDPNVIHPGQALNLP